MVCDEFRRGGICLDGDFWARQEQASLLLALQTLTTPHFFFNVLNIITAKAAEGDSEGVTAVCGNLAAVLRHVSDGRPTASVAEETACARAYLALMAARYEGGFHYTVDADPALGAKRLPRLALLHLCGDAFDQAFLQVEPPYTLALRVGENDGGWFIQVADNGGMAGQRRGLPGVLRRMEARCDIRAAAPRGTIVTLRMADEGIEPEERRVAG